MKQFIDATGRELEVGQYICYSAAHGRSPVLKFGRVVKLHDPEVQYDDDTPRWKKLEGAKKVAMRGVETGWQGEWKAQKNNSYCGFSERVLIVPAECVPPEALKLLA